MIELAAGDYRLSAAPERGGSILSFEWRGEALMRPACGPSILDAACFPLVPFSNRIANGRFTSGVREVRLRPNFPGFDHPHPLHGFGWLSPWAVIQQDAASAAMQHNYRADEWPWSYRAEQSLALDESGLTLTLTVTNQSAEPMPAGLGFHPYFPRDNETLYRGLHHGEWHNDADCLPLALDRWEMPRDWWNGEPVGTRAVDTVYTERAEQLEIAWPTRDLALTLECSEALSDTVVYSPAGEGFFCIEPVTHGTNAINQGIGMRHLRSGETFSVKVHMSATSCAPGFFTKS